MHKFSVWAYKSQAFAQSEKNFARSHDRETVTFRNSGISASGVNENCIGGQGEVLLLNVWYSAEALLLDP